MSLEDEIFFRILTLNLAFSGDQFAASLPYKLWDASTKVLQIIQQI